jgi:hypothetical protein
VRRDKSAKRLEGRMMWNDLNVDFFIHTDMDIKELVTAIEKFTTMKFDGHLEAECALYFLRLKENRHFDESKVECFNEGFLFYKYRLDVEYDHSNMDRSYITFLSEFLFYLWGHGMKVIASCDFENSLPYGGGYQSWVNYRQMNKFEVFRYEKQITA